MTQTSSRRVSRRFLFTIAGGYGHLHPLVPLARGLKDAGHEVAFAAGAYMQQAIEAAGFEHLRVGGNLASDPEYIEFDEQRRAMPLGFETEMVIYSRIWCGIATRLRAPQLVEIAQTWRPDMFVRETGEYGAIIAAEHLGLPHAAVAVTASVTGFSIFERGAAEQLDLTRRAWGLSPDPQLESLYRYLHIVYSPPSFATQPIEWAGLGAYAQPVPRTTHFVRPEFFDQASGERLPEWAERLRENGRPTVYATMGTEVNKEPGVYPHVLRAIAEGLRDMPLNLVVTVGKENDPGDLGPQPPNVHVERYIPQSLLLPQCDLAVMHGGSNSLLQAVDIGLAVVVVPLIADQFFNGHVAQRMGLGRVVESGAPGEPAQPERLTPGAFRAAAEEVLGNPEYRQNVARLRDEMQALPGQEYAVELVERAAAGSGPVVN